MSTVVIDKSDTSSKIDPRRRDMLESIRLRIQAGTKNILSVEHFGCENTPLHPFSAVVEHPSVQCFGMRIPTGRDRILFSVNDFFYGSFFGKKDIVADVHKAFTDIAEEELKKYAVSVGATSVDLKEQPAV